MNPAIFVLGPKPAHAHPDDKCFRPCPVWEYNLKSYKIRFQICSWRMQEVKRCGDSENGPNRMVALNGELSALSEVIKSMEG